MEPWDKTRLPHQIQTTIDGAGTHSIYDMAPSSYDHSGYLHCNLCDKYLAAPVWCKHMEDVVLRGVDGEHMNPHLRGGCCQLPKYTMVPIKPTLGFWVNVTVREADEFGGRKADLLTKMSTTLDLGVLYEGEGRLVVRSTIFDALRAIWSPEAVRAMYCPHGTHSDFKYNQGWTPEGELATDDLVSYLLIANKGCCILCWERLRGLGISTNNDDFAPEV